MKTPPYRVDYTKSAIEVYEHAKWKGYKFKTIRNLDSWLAYGWSLLFKRPITDFDIKNLTSFIKKRKNIELKQKHNVPLDINDKLLYCRHTLAKIYIYFTNDRAPECKNPQEKARLEKMLEDIKANKEQREIDDLKQMARRSYIKNYYKLEGRKLIKK